MQQQQQDGMGVDELEVRKSEEFESERASHKNVEVKVVTSRF